MGDLILYLGVTFVGFILGSKVRSHKEKFSWTARVQMVALIVLVLTMGMRMGSNEEVIANLSTIGISAFLMTVVIMACSILAIWLARQAMGIDRFGRMKNAGTGVLPSEGGAETAAAEEEAAGGNSTTVAIIASVAAGMAFGYLVIRRVFEGNMDQFDSLAGLTIKIGLCLLLVFIGLDLGLDGTVVDNFKKVGLRILVFPAVVIVGTLAGAAACSLFMEFSLKECLAIGAGFGWYTLAPGIIMENGYVTASAVAFLHNVMRELFSIIFIPLIAKKIGYIETTGMPGAAAMDVCLPIVEKSTRSDIAVYSFVSGVILSTAVPIMVPLIIG
jgi:uncharacterized membrane protein YbjE (DUF340 family)